MGKLKQQRAAGPLNAHSNVCSTLLNKLLCADSQKQLGDSFKGNAINGNLRVVPVESQPVEAFELVFPECVAVPVIPGALQLFPVSCRRPILHTAIKQTGLFHVFI